MAEEQAKAITEHYQKTFELTHEMWKERNRLFVYLVLTTGGGLLFLLRVPEFDRLLVETRQRPEDQRLHPNCRTLHQFPI